MLKFEKVNKTYATSESFIEVLKDINFSIKSGEFIAIMGPSGSGKSTLLGIAAGLDYPDSGKVTIDSVEITSESENSLCKLRAEKIGFIFQNFQLIRTLNALENVSLPLLISSKFSEDEIKKKAIGLLENVGLSHRITHYPSQLSGGEEQRVAVARSFMNDPRLLFADEPTGNLDSKNGKHIMELLVNLNKKNKSTLIVVTHDPKVANNADRVLLMDSGRIVNQKSSPKRKK
ncbi:MAG: ABC transporter ATP-binding protein [Leptospira sp.]|nr:ABC transporter ATP-binding protein [Leptospira sp.]